MRRARDNQRTFIGRIARIEHPHRNILADGRQNRRRMQHLGAEVGQFGGLFEADDLDAVRVRTDIGIGGHHAIDVGPYLDGLGIQSGAEERGRVVGAAAANGGLNPVPGGADEAAHHGHASGSEHRSHDRLRAGIDLLDLGDGLGVLPVGDHHLAGVHQRGVHPHGGEGGSAHLARQTLAVTDDVIRCAGRKLADGGNAAQQLVEGVELLLQSGMELVIARRTQQLTGGVVMPVAQSLRKLQSLLAVAASGGSSHG